MLIYNHLRDPHPGATSYRIVRDPYGIKYLYSRNAIEFGKSYLRYPPWRELDLKEARAPAYKHNRRRRIRGITRCMKMPPAVRQFYDRALLATPMPRLIHGMFANAA